MSIPEIPNCPPQEKIFYKNSKPLTTSQYFKARDAMLEHGLQLITFAKDKYWVVPKEADSSCRLPNPEDIYALIEPDYITVADMCPEDLDFVGQARRKSLADALVDILEGKNNLKVESL
jgi:hypothetical protein